MWASKDTDGGPDALDIESHLRAEALRAEVVAYLRTFGPFFHRTEQRRWSAKYIEGQLLGLGPKSVQEMARAMEGGNAQSMQQFISLGAWDDDVIRHQHQRLVAETLGDRHTGMLSIVNCEFPKQGPHSVGVLPQWCSSLGRIANCQASLMACYGSERNCTLVDARLYLPERWFTEEYRERRRECGVPNGLSFRNRPELAWGVVETLRRRNVLPFSWVTLDEHLGSDATLLERIATAGLNYLAEMTCHSRVWLRWQESSMYAALQTRRQLIWPNALPEAPTPMQIGHLAEGIPADRWERLAFTTDVNRSSEAEFAFIRAAAVTHELRGRPGWVVFRRRLAERPELSMYLSNASAATPHRYLALATETHLRAKSAIEECRHRLGMDGYQVRGWLGWHHHMTMSLLAHHFVVRMRVQSEGWPRGLAVGSGGLITNENYPHAG